MRAVRRAGLPVKMTQGFSPHPKISLARALKLGVESENEEATVVLREFIKPEEFKQRIENELPVGIRISQICLKKY
jgi:radical SAM-linked protein